MSNNTKIIISSNSFSIVRGSIVTFIFWEEIDYSKFRTDSWGKWLVIYTYKEKGVNISINLNELEGITKTGLKNVAKLINQIVDSIPRQKGRIVLKIFKLYENKILGKKLFNLINEYLSDFNESTFYSDYAPIFHRMKAEIFEKNGNLNEALKEINLSLELNTKYKNLIHPLSYLVKGRILFKLNKNKKEYMKYLKLAKNCRLTENNLNNGLKNLIDKLIIELRET